MTDAKKIIFFLPTQSANGPEINVAIDPPPRTAETIKDVCVAVSDISLSMNKRVPEITPRSYPYKSQPIAAKAKIKKVNGFSRKKDISQKILF